MVGEGEGSDPNGDEDDLEETEYSDSSVSTRIRGMYEKISE